MECGNLALGVVILLITICTLLLLCKKDGFSDYDRNKSLSWGGVPLNPVSVLYTGGGGHIDGALTLVNSRTAIDRSINKTKTPPWADTIDTDSTDDVDHFLTKKKKQRSRFKPGGSRTGVARRLVDRSHKD